MLFTQKLDKKALSERIKKESQLEPEKPSPKIEVAQVLEEREPEARELLADSFIRQELAGVAGVRVWELEKRAKEADINSKELTRAFSRAPVHRVSHPFPEGDHVEWNPWGELEAHEAVSRLLGYSEWSDFFVDLCELGLERFRAQVWQFRDGLLDRGAEFSHAQIEDALFELAQELPDTPVGKHDPREVLFKQAVAWLVENVDPERHAEFTEGLDWYVPLGEFRGELRRRLGAMVRDKVA